MKNKLITIAAILSLSFPLFVTTVADYFPLAISQLEIKKNPVLLIHGYASNISVWKNWETLLKADNITFKAVEFKDHSDTWVNKDECGSTFDHALELNDIVKNFRKST